MRKEGRDGKRRDDRGPALPEIGRRIPRSTQRRLLTWLWLRPLLRIAGGWMFQGVFCRGRFRGESGCWHGLRLVDSASEYQRTARLKSQFHCDRHGRRPLNVLPRSTRAEGSLVVAGVGGGFLDRLFHRFTGFTSALLNPTQDLFDLAFGELKIVIRQLGPFLFQFALGDVPVAFDFECVHGSSFAVLFP